MPSVCSLYPLDAHLCLGDGGLFECLLKVVEPRHEDVLIGLCQITVGYVLLDLQSGRARVSGLGEKNRRRGEQLRGGDEHASLHHSWFRRPKPSTLTTSNEVTSIEAQLDMLG